MRTLGIAGALVAVQLAINLGGLIGRLGGEDVPPLWNLDLEANIPVWWSVILLAAVSALAAALAWADERRERAPLWLFASVIALYLSLDEVALLHERLGDAITADEGNVRQWVLVLGPIFIVALAILSRLLGALSTGERVMAMAAAGLYVVALAVEAFSIWDEGAREYIGVVIEENAEMLGSALAVTALVSALSRRVAVSRVSAP